MSKLDFITKIINFLKSLFLLLFSKKNKDHVPLTPKYPIPDPVADKEEEKKEVPLLKPITHRRYISIYCIADLDAGATPILTVGGQVIFRITNRSLGRLKMEGTGRLPDGRVVNVDRRVNGEWRYRVMGPEEKDGVGIRGQALCPWFSLAHHLGQLNEHDLFERRVVIPELNGYILPGNAAYSGTPHGGIFSIHDTGGGLRPCPYSRGLWRSGNTNSECGQFDLFIGGPESLYKELLKTWKSYKEVYVVPRDFVSTKGIQETINLLLDTGLEVDGIEGPKTKAAIMEIRIKAGLSPDGGWDEEIKKFAKDSVWNYKEL